MTSGEAQPQNPQPDAYTARLLRNNTTIIPAYSPEVGVIS